MLTIDIEELHAAIYLLERYAFTEERVDRGRKRLLAKLSPFATRSAPVVVHIAARTPEDR